MSELAAKLARRRALNGEGDAQPSTQSSSPPVTSVTNSTESIGKIEQEEAAEKAVRDKEEQEAADKAARDKAGEAAAEKAARDKAEQEVAAEKAARDKAEQEIAAEKAARDKAEQEAAEEAARDREEQEAAAENKAKELAEHETIASSITDAVVEHKDDDELKELENFFDNMNDDAYLMDGLALDHTPAPPMSREPSDTPYSTNATNHNNNNNKELLLFAEDSSVAFSCAEGDGQGGRRHTELSEENNRLQSEETSLTNEVGAKDAQIRKIQKQIDSFTRRMQVEGEEGGESGKREGRASSRDPAEESSTSGHSLLSFMNKSPRDLFADDTNDNDEEEQLVSLDVSEEQLERSNRTLVEQVSTQRERRLTEPYRTDAVLLLCACVCL